MLIAVVALGLAAAGVFLFTRGAGHRAQVATAPSVRTAPSVSISPAPNPSPVASPAPAARPPAGGRIFSRLPSPCSTPAQATSARLVPAGKIAERFQGLTVSTCTYLSSTPPFPSLRVETRLFPVSVGLGDPIQQARDFFAAGLSQAQKGDGITTTLSLQQESGLGDQAYRWSKRDNGDKNLVGEVFVQVRNATVVIDYSQDNPSGNAAATQQRLLDEATSVAREAIAAFG
ncbi:MAG TPA: hypothetical protein VNW94_01790 [Streptosporangiaceae bacterium]|nr:hypothetical protein [Streptosporangiaceae bacterium]